jgi:Flp pilus assembly protein TadD
MLGAKPKAEAILTDLKARDVACASKCPDAAELKTAITDIMTAINGGQITSRSDQSLIFAGAEQGDALYLAAVGLINQGRYQAAIDQLETAQLSFGPHPDVLTYLGFANRKLGRLAVAERYYTAALAAAPAHRGATEYYGELMVERGDLAGAKMMLARLDAQCQFGCAEAEELRRWVVAGRSPHS